MSRAGAGFASSVLRTFALDSWFTFARRSAIAIVAVAFASWLAFPAIAAATFRSEFRRNERFVIATGSTHNFDALRLFPSTLRSEYGDDVDAIHHEVSVGANDIANLGAGKEQRTVEFPLGQLGAGCSPGPGSVFTSTSEFNFDAA
jgi:hypothetical protein